VRSVSGVSTVTEHKTSKRAARGHSCWARSDHQFSGTRYAILSRSSRCAQSRPLLGSFLVLNSPGLHRKRSHTNLHPVAIQRRALLAVRAIAVRPAQLPLAIRLSRRFQRLAEIRFHTMSTDAPTTKSTSQRRCRPRGVACFISLSRTSARADHPSRRRFRQSTAERYPAPPGNPHFKQACTGPLSVKTVSLFQSPQVLDF
jgi:hypothetical protein